ncbi:hypothetical protein SLEP1_g6984 [Rubroshorea leprosula]|uniref:Uncharacterized protein n=1 Tax=Rubroshorea leprosula TaxID=152421 RepID=A0AAV5I6S3_9ROSI|nr:hypothetical protein SLEP1_g6984 [Rubroshorea leprosula]
MSCPLHAVGSNVATTVMPMFSMSPPSSCWLDLCQSIIVQYPAICHLGRCCCNPRLGQQNMKISRGNNRN